MEALANGNFRMSAGDHAGVVRAVNDVITPDAPISPYVVAMASEDNEFYKTATAGFVTALQRIGGDYYGHVAAGDYEHPLVRLLEGVIPDALLPVMRQEPARLSFTRLDFHDGKIIEYNSSPGFMALESIINQALHQQGVAAEHGLTDATPHARQAGSLVVERVLQPLANGKANPTVAVLDRLGESRTNIYGELEYLAALGESKGMEMIFPASSDDFTYTERGLVHDATATTVDVVHLAASEGPDFERWLALADSPIYRAYLDGAVGVWPRPSNALMTSKFILAYLSDPAYEGVFAVSQKERDALRGSLPTTRILDAEQGEVIKQTVAAGQVAVIKPSNGSGGRGVEILTNRNRKYRNHVNQAVRGGHYVSMDHCPPPTLDGSLVYTSDVVAFLDPAGGVDRDAFIHTSRVFAGEKANFKSVDGGMAAVMQAPIL